LQSQLVTRSAPGVGSNASGLVPGARYFSAVGKGECPCKRLVGVRGDSDCHLGGKPGWRGGGKACDCHTVIAGGAGNNHLAIRLHDYATQRLVGTRAGVEIRVEHAFGV
jgi:hypothetical protein